MHVKNNADAQLFIQIKNRKYNDFGHVLQHIANAPLANFPWL